MQPDLSVIIASINGPEYLRECLKALSRQNGSLETEVIVADCVGDSITTIVKGDFPPTRVSTNGTEFPIRLT